MKILNPNYVAPADAAAANLKTKLTAYFQTHPNVQAVTVAQLQAALPVDSAGMAQGYIEQIARDAGWIVKGDD